MALFEPSHPPLWCSHYSPLYFMPRADSSRSIPPPNPPRPPNAWILYRSDKLKDLPQPPPGIPRRPQADISKTISSMWKSESPEVRAHYERLSDIKKAEHQALYPGYRFQPMKKADKDRLRAEKQAERERQRGARKLKNKPRSADPPPLFTTQARPNATSTAAPDPATPIDAPSAPSTAAPATPPTPPAYPAPPATPHIPSPIIAPQPAVPQRPPSPSDWPPRDSPDFDAFFTLPDADQEYLTVPLPHPQGWSPSDPAPHTDIPFFPQSDTDTHHPFITPTCNPYAFEFNLGNFAADELFDTSRTIEVSVGTTAYPDPAPTQQLWDLFSELDQHQQYSFEHVFHNQDLSLVVPADPDPAPAYPDPTPPYVPPAGAANSSTRRVAADWRHIRLSTPESV